MYLDAVRRSMAYEYPVSSAQKELENFERVMGAHSYRWTQGDYLMAQGINPSWLTDKFMLEEHAYERRTEDETQ